MALVLFGVFSPARGTVSSCEVMYVVRIGTVVDAWKKCVLAHGNKLKLTSSVALRRETEPVRFFPLKN